MINQHVVVPCMYKHIHIMHVHFINWFLVFFVDCLFPQHHHVQLDHHVWLGSRQKVPP